MTCLGARLELGSVSLWDWGRPHWAVTLGVQLPRVCLPLPSPLAGSPGSSVLRGQGRLRQRFSCKARCTQAQPEPGGLWAEPGLGPRHAGRWVGKRPKPVPPPAGVLGAGASSSRGRPGGLCTSPGGGQQVLKLHPDSSGAVVP